jgi:hypothetical protein
VGAGSEKRDAVERGGEAQAETVVIRFGWRSHPPAFGGRPPAPRSPLPYAAKLSLSNIIANRGSDRSGSSHGATRRNISPGSRLW